MDFNIADLFESLVDAVPERTAVVAGDKRLTFGELEARANRLANVLLGRGVRPGQHVGLHLYNGAEFVEAMLATFKIRAVPVNINYRYVEGELEYLFANADLVAILTQRELLPRVAAVAPKVPTLRTLIVVEDGAEASAPGLEPLGYEAVLATSSPTRNFPKRSGEDLYVIYTGGTTGMPRGVMWHQADVFFAGLQGGNPGGPPIDRPEELAELVRQNTDPLTFLPAAPFIHGAAQWAALIGLFGGGKVVIAAGKSYNAKLICQLVDTERVNTMTFVGDAMARPLVDALRAEPDRYDMTSLMVIASAGAILSDAVKRDLQEVMPHTMILNSFGATETGHQGTSGAFGGGEPSGPHPSFFMDDSNTVLGDDHKPIQPGSGVVGKLARSGRLPLGYYKDPEKTKATFVTLDGKRWVLPGDLATIEADGRITVFGRGAVCINSGGEKVFPEEVESALKAHPSVHDAVVVGVPDEKWGQKVAAIVQPRPGTTVTLEIVEAHCRTLIAGYKVPRQLQIVDEVQRQPSGKPDYRWAAAMARGAS